MSATSQLLTDLVRRLIGPEREIHVICSRQLYENPRAKLPAYELSDGIHVHRLWTTTFGRSSHLGRATDYATFYWSAAIALLRIVKPNDILVAKTDPPLISIVVAEVARMRQAHLINWLQDIFPEVASKLGENPLPKWLDALFCQLRSRSLSAARMNVVLGSRMREHLLQQKIIPERICVIENWADGIEMEPSSETSSLRKTYGLDNQFVIGYSGNMGRAHEFETILEAATILRERHDIVFLMIGGGAKMQQLKSAVESRLLSNFRFVPYQPRELLSKSLAIANIHLASLLPPLEGLIVPSKFYGILAAGRPVIFIGDRDGELARIILAAQCGSVLNCGDSEALIEAIYRFKEMPDVLHRTSHSARQLFEREYTVEHATRKWRALLQNEVMGLS